MKVERYRENPIILPTKKFESRFNPALLEFNGKYYLYVRVVDDYCNYISYIDLYESQDGIHFNLIKEKVIKPELKEEKYGCEDPRANRVNGKIYITYTGISNHAWKNPNPTVMLLELKNPLDFKSYKKLGSITKFVKDDKNAVFLPDKYKDYYVLIHRPYTWNNKPSIWMSFSKDLKNWNNHRILIEPTYDWEDLKVGAGPQPLKTDFGYILIYHGVSQDRVYSVGLAVLDLKEPWKVIYKHEEPIWKPEKWYEKYGDVPNVVFPTGAVIRDNKIWIYAGASDKYVVLGFLNLEELVDVLKSRGII